MPEKIRVTILEDHPGIIDGYRFRLGNRPEIEILDSVSFGEDLEPALKAHPADVLLLDVSVPTSRDNPNPYPLLHLIPQLIEIYPEMRMLVISMHTERGLIRAIMESGASGYILKDDQKAIQDLAGIVLSVARGEIYFSEKVDNLINSRKAFENIPLTPRQMQVLALCQAYPDSTTTELGQKMGISHSTVRNLLSTAYLRLNVRSRGAAVARARQLGLITADPPTMPIGQHNT